MSDQKTDPGLAICVEAVRFAEEHRTPSPNLAEAIDQAQHGPEDVKERTTLAVCPACRFCMLCEDSRLVQPTVADAYLRANAIPLDSQELDEE